MMREGVTELKKAIRRVSPQFNSYFSYAYLQGTLLLQCVLGWVQCVCCFQSIYFLRMARTLKEFSSSSFYNTHHTDHIPFANHRRLVLSNAETIEHLTIEVQCRLDKLKERAAADQAKVERNYLELEQLAGEIEQQCHKLANEKQVESIVRTCRENVKAGLGENRGRAGLLCGKAGQQMVALRQGLQLRERELQREKELRQGDMLKLIDEFEGELLLLEKQLKQIRTAEEQVFERLEVSTYNLEQDFSSKMESQRSGRKREHETIIRLIGECIEKFTLIY